MSEFDRNRIALVATEPPDTVGQRGQGVGTGYFLTGDLVLTARHVLGGEGWTFLVRAEGEAPEENLWSAARPCWIGADGTDAMLLRTEKLFGEWEPPAFPAVQADGTWISAGYAKSAVDVKRDNRKTQPLSGPTPGLLGISALPGG